MSISHHFRHKLSIVRRAATSDVRRTRYEVRLMHMATPRTIKLILGIGNPEAALENTYHNAGMLALEYLAARDGAPAFRRVSHKAFSYARGTHFIFARSLVYMNESGRSAQDACVFFKVHPNALLILHDESDLVLGSFKLSSSQGAAGHKGVASIAHTLGTNSFGRVRIGIRPKETVRRKAGEFVLSPIPPGDYAELTNVFKKIGVFLGLDYEAD